MLLIFVRLFIGIITFSFGMKYFVVNSNHWKMYFCLTGCFVSGTERSGQVTLVYKLLLY